MQMNNSKASNVAWIIVITVLVTALVICVVGIAHYTIFDNGLGTAVNVDKNANSASRGLLYEDASKVELVMESYGKVDHSYTSQELSVEIGDSLENMMCLTAHYECGTPYYDRPKDKRNTDVPKDAEFDWVEVSSMSSNVEKRHLDELQSKLRCLSDVKINKSYIESMLSISSKSGAYLEMVDDTNERFNVVYTTEVSPYLGYIINVRVDTNKQRVYTNIDNTPKNKKDA